MYEEMRRELIQDKGVVETIVDDTKWCWKQNKNRVLGCAGILSMFAILIYVSMYTF